MSDKSKDVVKSSSESQETPNPTISQENSQGSPGNQDDALNALIEQARPRLEELVRSIAQSDKDVGIASAKKDAKEARKEVSDMRSVVDKFKSFVEIYGSDERALAEMERDQRLIDLERSSSGQSSVGTEKKSWKARQDEILMDAKLEPNDHRAVEFAASQDWDSYDQYLDALQVESFKWFQADAKKPQPSSSAVANTSSGVIPAVDFDEAETEDLGAELLALSVDYTKNEKRIKQINAELRKRDTGA